MIRSYYTLLRTWLWLLVLTTLIGGAISYVVAQREADQYVATSRLMVGPATSSVNPELNDLRAAQQLLEVYASLPGMRPFLEDVIANLGLSLSPSALERMITITTDSTTQQLTIRVSSEDGALAPIVANTVADSLVALSPGANVDPTASARLMDQIDRLQSVLARSDARLIELEYNRDNARTAETRAQAESQIAQERAYQAEAERLVASLYTALQDSPINRVVVLEPAIEGRAVDRQMGLKVLLGALAGLVLGATVVFAAEYFNNTIRDLSEVTLDQEIPVLGTISTHRTARAARHDMLTVLSRPESAAADRYQRLGTHLQFTEIRDALHTLLVTDVASNIGAGETAANLAIVLARLGTNVVLADADGHESVISHQFGLGDRPGLSDYLTGDETDITRLALKVVDLPRLSVLPFGQSRSDQFSLVTSPRLQDALAELRKATDLVIIAGPPLMQNAGGFVLGSRVNKTLLVVTSGQTTRDQLREVVHELRAVDAGILGVLLATPVRRPSGGLPFNRRRPTAVTVDPTLVGQAPAQAARKTVRS